MSDTVPGYSFKISYFNIYRKMVDRHFEAGEDSFETQGQY